MKEQNELILLDTIGKRNVYNIDKKGKAVRIYLGEVFGRNAIQKLYLNELGKFRSAETRTCCQNYTNELLSALKKLDPDYDYKIYYYAGGLHGIPHGLIGSLAYSINYLVDERDASETDKLEHEMNERLDNDEFYEDILEFAVECLCEDITDNLSEDDAGDIADTAITAANICYKYISGVGEEPDNGYEAHVTIMQNTPLASKKDRLAIIKAYNALRDAGIQVSIDTRIKTVVPPKEIIINVRAGVEE